LGLVGAFFGGTNPSGKLAVDNWMAINSGMISSGQHEESYILFLPMLTLSKAE
jgi:hypothetical protein